MGLIFPFFLPPTIPRPPIFKEIEQHTADLENKNLISDKIKLKTYIVMNGVSIHNLDEFKKNFVIEEVMDYFHNCTLLKWLLDCKYNNEAEAIRKIMNDPLYDFTKDVQGRYYCGG